MDTDEFKYWLVRWGTISRGPYEKSTLREALKRTFGSDDKTQIAVDLGTRIVPIRSETQRHRAMLQIERITESGVYEYNWGRHTLTKIGNWTGAHYISGVQWLVKEPV